MSTLDPLQFVLFPQLYFYFLKIKTETLWIRQTGTFLHALGLHFFNSIELWEGGRESCGVFRKANVKVCIRSSARPLSQNSFPLTQNIHLFQQRICCRRIINVDLILERFKRVFRFSMRVPINPERSKTSGVSISNKLAH